MDFLKQATTAPTSFEQAKVQLTELSVAIEREEKLIEQQRRQTGGTAPAAAAKRK